MYFREIENSAKFKFSSPCKLELTVFINVKILSLKASTKLILNRVSKPTSNVNDKINIITVKKYLFISLKSIFVFENNILLRMMCLGFECESNSLNENFVKRQIFKNLNPELVDTRDPPIMTKSKKIKLF